MRYSRGGEAAGAGLQPTREQGESSLGSSSSNTGSSGRNSSKGAGGGGGGASGERGVSGDSGSASGNSGSSNKRGSPQPAAGGGGARRSDKKEGVARSDRRRTRGGLEAATRITSGDVSYVSLAVRDAAICSSSQCWTSEGREGKNVFLGTVAFHLRLRACISDFELTRAAPWRHFRASHARWENPSASRRNKAARLLACLFVRSFVLEQQIGQEIGRGGFGIVFQALNTATGDFVAVKRMEMDSVKLDAGASIKVCQARTTRCKFCSTCVCSPALSTWIFSGGVCRFRSVGGRPELWHTVG